MRIRETIKDNQEVIYYKLNKHRHRKRLKKKLHFKDYDEMMRNNRGVDERKC